MLAQLSSLPLSLAARDGPWQQPQFSTEPGAGSCPSAQPQAPSGLDSSLLHLSQTHRLRFAVIDTGVNSTSR